MVVQISFKICCFFLAKKRKEYTFAAALKTRSHQLPAAKELK